MAWATEFLRGIRLITKLHDRCLQSICREYGLTRMEATIIMFLKNNPGLDTAADLVELRMLSKSHVSQGVESLIQKSLLARTPDPSDRRKVHLSLLPASAPVTASIDQIQGQFMEEVFQGFSREEQELFLSMNRRIMENVRQSAARLETSPEKTAERADG